MDAAHDGVYDWLSSQSHIGSCLDDYVESHEKTNWAAMAFVLQLPLMKSAVAVTEPRSSRTSSKLLSP